LSGGWLTPKRRIARLGVFQPRSHLDASLAKTSSIAAFLARMYPAFSAAEM
jgi:hypothetical protein